MTDEELNALVNRAERLLSSAEHMNEADGVEVVSPGIVPDLLTAITTLRAQLAEAHKDGSQLAAWQCLFDDGKTGIVCDDWGNQYCAMQRRADRAEQRVATLEHEVRLREAALAAQIEADAGIADSHDYGFMSMTDADMRAVTIANAIRNQPRAGAAEHGSYDRTALDRYREKVLREAYDSLFKHPGFIHVISGQKFKAVKLEDAAEAILALIEKEKTK